MADKAGTRIEGAYRFTGRVLFGMFRTIDLRPWIPTPLEALDPHAGLVKVYQLKMRNLDSDPRAPAYSQYQQVCLTCLATAGPGTKVGNFNLLLWEDRSWTLLGGEQTGWRKRMGTIEQTWSFPMGARWDRDTSDVFAADVHRHGRSLFELRARLDATGPPPGPPPLDTFYNVRANPPSLVTTLVSNVELDARAHGTGTLRLAGAPDDLPEDAELLNAIGAVELETCLLSDVTWLRTYGG